MAMVTDAQVASRESGWRERLRGAGLRVTQPRLAVLEAVCTDSHLAAEQVADQVRNTIGPVSTQAIYDALNTLTEHEILRRIEPAGSAMLFEINTRDNHHHIVCRNCGAIRDVPCDVGAVPCAVPPQAGGFLVDQAEVTYWGLCAECLDRESGGLDGAHVTSAGIAQDRRVSSSSERNHQHPELGDRTLSTQPAHAHRPSSQL